ncbi:hypothetical protein [Nocardioides sp.]|uniref:hypothetical protein n=1 Tax=Nocardioides sp. TaxID=35761 RepID=UPI0027355D8A|nr:hypothetical protein [Nocardioides sp.]MDP3889660.1 hypothetical protein [Nocardioides sp.]
MIDPAERKRLIAELGELFPSEVEGSDHPEWSTEEVRDNGDVAVLMGRFGRDPHLYGIPIDLTDRRHEFYYTDYPVEGDEEWLDSVGVGLMVMLGTGFRACARRRKVDDYIELSQEGGWPVDERFYLQDADPGFTRSGRRPHEIERLAQKLREDGLDTALALERRSQGRLVHWLLAYENTAPSGPWVGQAVISAAGPHRAVLEQVETAPGVPVTVRLDLAYFVSHAAAERGIRTITTTLPDSELNVAGFEPAEDGHRRVLDTSFLAAEPDEARALLEADLARGEAWGQDRDLAGHHVPRSRLGRLLHRLRGARSDKPPNLHAG